MSETLTTIVKGFVAVDSASKAFESIIFPFTVSNVKCSFAVTTEYTRVWAESASEQVDPR